MVPTGALLPMWWGLWAKSSDSITTAPLIARRECISSLPSSEGMRITSRAPNARL